MAIDYTNLIKIIRREMGHYLKAKNTWIGMQWGKVMSNPDEDPDKQDRVSVYYQGLPEGQVFPYAKPLIFGAGTDPQGKDHAGMYFPPKKGDDVMLITYNNDPNWLYYIAVNSLKNPIPADHLVKPHYRWGIWTKLGHFIKMYDDVLKRRIEIHSIGNSWMIIDDNKNILELNSHDGDIFRFDCPNKETIWQTTNNDYVRIRKGEVKDITIQQGHKESFLWMKDNGDVHLHAEETLTLSGKGIKVLPSEMLYRHIPESYFVCKESGTDYVQCPPPPRESECFSCDSDVENVEKPERPPTLEKHEHYDGETDS